MGGCLMLKLADECVIYARVSSDKQVREGNGLESQIIACKEYARKNDIRVIQVFKDPAKSGKDTIRPGLMAMLDFLKSREEFTYVVIDDIFRLSRNVAEYHPLKALIQNHKGILKDLKNVINEDNPNDPNAAFLENIIASFGQLERQLIKKRVNERQRARLLEGNYVYPAPRGYKFENKVLTATERNSKLINQIYRDFVNGKYSSYQEVIDCNEIKLIISPRTQKPYLSWKSEDVKKLLTNKLYMGKVEKLDKGVNERDGKHEAMVDEKTFNQVQLLLKKKGSKRHTKIISDEFPLKGNLICGNCKRTLVYSKAKGRSKSYPYYRCNSSRANCDTNPKNIRADKIHDDYSNLLKNASIHPKILKMADHILEDIYKEKSDHLIGIQKTKESTIKDLSQKRDKLINILIDSDNKNVRKALEKKINKIDSQISDLETQKENTEFIESFKLEGIKLLENPKEKWLEANYHEKKLIFDFVFDKPLEITRGKIGTAPYALPYSLLARKETQKEGMVELGGIEPPTSTVPR